MRPINRGAHSIVHLALHRSSQRYVALKVLSKERLLCAGPAAAREVLREKRALLAVQPHPFLTALHATFQDATRLFLVLELGLGGDLRGILIRRQRRRRGLDDDRLRGALQLEHARFYAAALVLALSHLHAHGFVYRDLKPENVLLDASGYPQLCDLGSAVHLGDSGRANTLVGTWEYAAPEVLEGRGSTLAADWWSLGALLLESLGGEPPFSSGDDDDPLQALAAARQFGPDAPLLVGVCPSARALMSECLLLFDERHRWRACRDDAVRAHAFFAPIDFDALRAHQLPPPHEPTLLGDADTRNFFHASLAEPDAGRIGVGLTGDTEASPAEDDDSPSTQAPPKRLRGQRAAALDCWEGF